MKPIPVTATCPVCKTNQINVYIREIHFEGERRIGGGGRTREFEIASIYCNNSECRIKFQSVPGQPEIAEKFRRDVQNEHNPLC